MHLLTNPLLQWPKFELHPICQTPTLPHLQPPRFTLPHAPYSPDLSPSDYFLSPILKKRARWSKIFTNEEVMSAVNGYFEEQDSSFYKKSTEIVEH
ncbi:hypothetical protein TNCV_1223911 [Trichonephila clavipes]|nr:hypothetical protein TNCV_1223911 [Trichonephila clavipes]